MRFSKNNLINTILIIILTLIIFYLNFSFKINLIIIFLITIILFLLSFVNLRKEDFYLFLIINMILILLYLIIQSISNNYFPLELNSIEGFTLILTILVILITIISIIKKFLKITKK